MKNKLEFAKQIVLEAGDYLRLHLHDDLMISKKTGPTDLVTQMDQQVQKDLVEKITHRYPEDRIFAEEDGLRSPISEGSVWVIDPIDGTNNFVTQKEDFAVMVAYFEEGIGQFGLIYDVMRDHLFFGGKDFGVFCNEQELQPFQNRPLSDLLVASNVGMLKSNAWGMADLGAECLGIRVYGSAGISFTKILSGGILGYFSYIWPWDYAAAAIMGECLGYSVLTLEGKEPNYETLEPIMMVPTCKLDEIQPFLKKGTHA